MATEPYNASVMKFSGSWAKFCSSGPGAQTPTALHSNEIAYSAGPPGAAPIIMPAQPRKQSVGNKRRWIIDIQSFYMLSVRNC